MTKAMIEQQYDVAILEYKTAHNEDEQWEARKHMAKLEQTAGILYGFDYLDEITTKKEVLLANR